MLGLGGLPIGACMVVEKVSQAVGVGEHGSTFAGKLTEKRLN